ncbi:MAG: glycosyltransferase family 4 protein [Lachnospiraceae bacterium]|nr:glycosyltransferase family 4 protein [Lachnospiraceae bacterium]
MKRILYITHYDNMYGANRALLDLVLGVNASGRYEPVVVIPAEGDFTEILKSKGIGYFICGITQWQAVYREPVSFALKKKKRLAAIERETDILYDHFKDAGIDIIHSNSSVIGTGALLAERLGCEHIWHIREFAREHYGMRYFYPGDRVSKLYGKAKCLIAISDAVSDNCKKKYPDAKVIRVYDGVAADKKVPEEETENKKAAETETSDTAYHKKSNCEKTEFLYTGYLFPAKHQLDVIKAAALLKKKNKTGFHITFAGDGDPAYRKKLESCIAKNGLGTNVTISGFVKDVGSLLDKADVGIIASEYEGFGLATVEYMLSGLPVIGRRSGATPEIVKDGDTGILYDDISGLADAMLKLMDDKALCMEMGEKGDKRAGALFTDTDNLTQIMQVYDNGNKEKD